MSQAIEIVQMDIKDLKPAPYNPREISDKALKGLQESIKQFGIVQPIVWNKRTGYVVGGHQRVAAMAEMGYTTVPVAILDLDDQQEKALNLALNNPKTSGVFTEEVDELLAEIRNSMPETFKALMLSGIHGEVKRGDDLVEGQIQFATELMEENNYIVLAFKNKVDWLNAQTVLGLGSSYSRRRNGKPWSKGLGRVIDGPSALKKLRDEAIQ
ncbi:MAG: hypothetical protein DMF62_02365 [Acidobacteria bacterium]|nr:MAG: hypothetical protein DMF62_02365 [Acidobacteriota bacterium]